ncbi:MAG: hypothetical protein JWR68_2151 [Polaromonas sp.]|jgi:uncharacterized membrane protein|nr:hypothetical protein [Polaromonas sp.]
MDLSPTIAIHLAAAASATVIGPVALWARLAGLQRPRLHRAFGYAWVTLMLFTAVSALFIRDFRLPNLGGYTPIHLLVPITFAGLFGAFWALREGNIRLHRRSMLGTYIGGNLIAGAFTLVPGRYLGNLLWNSLGLL